MEKGNIKSFKGEKYIRNDIPEFELPVYKGERYDAFIPDTLDIQERATLAVNGLTGPTDPEKDYRLYFFVHFNKNPPDMVHDMSDICQTKFEEALPLMRLASGSSLNNQVDKVWMKTALRQIGPDGLFYWSYYPWAPNAAWGKNFYKKGYDLTLPLQEEYYSLPAFCGRRIGAMTAYMLRDPSGPWDEEIKKIVDGLWSVVIEKEDYAYFPQGEFWPDKPRVKNAALPQGIWASLVGWTIQGLAQYQRVSGYKPAVELAEKLSRYLVKHGCFYGPNGEFLQNTTGETIPDEKEMQGFDPGDVCDAIHFAHHMTPLLGLTDLALATGNRDLTEFVKESFEWAKTKGNIIVGYFPETTNNLNVQQTSELCDVAGMIGMALKLSAAGIGDYWDDADRWIRNQFAEGQLTQVDWIYRMREEVSPVDNTGNLAYSFPLEAVCTEKVPERNIGAFVGWPSANESGAAIMQCCTGNSARALYFIWEHMLSYDNGTVSVNLLLNRPSKWVDVHSYIPYEGQVDIVVKSPCKLRVRIPEWTKPDEIACTVNDNRDCTPGWEGRYAIVGNVKPNDKVSVKFPISEKTVTVDIEKRKYILTIKGNDVVNINPPGGRYGALYQRNHYRQNTVRWKKVQRFVSEESICW